MIKVDTLIIGQGLAGSLLAWELTQRGQKVLVLDDGADNASSIAAGIVNPITGQRLAKQPDVETLLPAARNLYATLKAYFNETFFIEMPMLRLIGSKDESNYAHKRHNNPHYQTYLGALNDTAIVCGPFKTAHGYLAQQQTARLLIPDLLRRIREWLRADNAYLCARFEYPDLDIGKQVRWQNVCAQRLIFCEGHAAANNPWFRWLPFTPAKGEILTLTQAPPLSETIYNFGYWLLPDGNGQVRLGATFERDFTGNKPTESGKQRLLTALWQREIQPVSWQVVAHQAGIRPGTADRQPFIGLHPFMPQLAIFNGFGAKGSLLIPWHVRQFADHLLCNNPLPFSSAIDRYRSRLSAN